MNAALGYAAQGFYVFPIVSKGKKPLTTYGFSEASIDPAHIKAWWAQWPNANIGIATGKASGFWVLDIDGEYPSDWPPLEIKPTVRTARGVHFYFKYPDGQEIKCKIKMHGKDVDVRGDGGYVIAPPSIHPSGVRYEFIA